MHHTDAESVAYWEAWAAAHPEHAEVVAAAKRMVTGIAFVPREISEQEIDQQWTQLQQRLSASVEPTDAPRWRWNRWAAVVGAFLAITGLLTWWAVISANQPLVYTTHYGETQSIVLPDGSHVTLNANSRLLYRPATADTPVRRASLTGEAFFDVAHQKGDSATAFLVYTPDLEVKVLGTEFNVNTRQGRTQVVLDDGSIELKLPQRRALMQPGDMVEYQRETEQIRRSQVDTDLFVAWRDRRLKFDDTPLAEVAQLLEDNYGVRVYFADRRLRHKRVTGEISAQQLDIILKALSRLFDISVQQSGNTVRIAALHVSP